MQPVFPAAFSEWSLEGFLGSPINCPVNMLGVHNASPIPADSAPVPLWG